MRPSSRKRVQCKALHAAPHIGVPHRDPDPRDRWDHLNAFRAAPNSAGDADAKMLTFLPRARSMIIAGVYSVDFPTPLSMIVASANPDSAAGPSWLGRRLAQLVPPCVDQSRGDIVPPRHLRNRRESLPEDLKPLLVAPPPATLDARINRDLAHQPLLSPRSRALQSVLLSTVRNSDTRRDPPDGYAARGARGSKQGCARQASEPSAACGGRSGRLWVPARPKHALHRSPRAVMGPECAPRSLDTAL